ncbi:TPA: VirB4-like conjugal transfer ATPase, CD1110 family [Streptococcus suis]
MPDRKKQKQTERLLQSQEKQLKQVQKELRGEGKQSIVSAIKNYFDLGDKCFSTEDTIPFEIMYDNGICLLNDGYYTKMLVFEDINYQLALEEQRDFIFNQFAGFLNSFDASTRLQLCFTNQLGRLSELEDAITIPSRDDELEEIRLEFRTMLHNQLEKGNNGLRQAKYVVFGVKEDNYRQARVVLSRLEIDLQTHLKGMGIRSRVLDGRERMQVLHHILNPNKELGDTSSLDKTAIVPDKMHFQKNCFSMDNAICQSSHIQVLASELSDRFLSELLALEENMVLTLHIQALEQMEAIKLVKRKFTDVQRMTMEEQKKAYRSGYDLDIIPSDLSAYGTDLKHLLTDLQSRDEKMFLVTIVLVNQATKRSNLNNAISQLAMICGRHNCLLKSLDYQQEQGLVTALPLGYNQIAINRQLTTSSTAVFIPFTTEELFMPSATSLYYGLNAISHNLIMADRKQLKNPNGLILGTPGSGKSFSAKREISNAILITDDDILICDPEGEVRQEVVL